MSTTVSTTTPTVERIAAAVKEVTARMRINGLDAIGFNARRWNDDLILVDIHAGTATDVNRIANYFGCTNPHNTKGVAMWDTVKLVGAPIMVGVYGPAPVAVSA